MEKILYNLKFTDNLRCEKNKDLLESVTNTVTIKTKLSTCSISQFYNDLDKLSSRLPKDTNYIIIKLFLQIGKTENNNSVFNYKNKDDVDVYIQPKIGNYVTFKSKEIAEDYKNNELDENDLYLFLEVKNGTIIY